MSSAAPIIHSFWSKYDLVHTFFEVYESSYVAQEPQFAASVESLARRATLSALCRVNRGLYEHAMNVLWLFCGLQ